LRFYAINVTGEPHFLLVNDIGRLNDTGKWKIAKIFRNILNWGNKGVGIMPSLSPMRSWFKGKNLTLRSLVGRSLLTTTNERKEPVKSSIDQENKKITKP
jgi:hypothetical protein